jgi:hypothetical protein
MNFIKSVRKNLKRSKKESKFQIKIYKDEKQNFADELSESEMLKELTILYGKKKSLDFGVRKIQQKVMGLDNQKKKVAGNLNILMQRFKKLPKSAKAAALSKLNVPEEYVSKLKNEISRDIQVMHNDLAIGLRENSVGFRQMKAEKELIDKQRSIGHKLHKIYVDEFKKLDDATRKERKVIKLEKKEIRSTEKENHSLAA